MSITLRFLPPQLTNPSNSTVPIAVAHTHEAAHVITDTFGNVTLANVAISVRGAKSKHTPKVFVYPKLRDESLWFVQVELGWTFPGLVLNMETEA